MSIGTIYEQINKIEIMNKLSQVLKKLNPLTIYTLGDVNFGSLDGERDNALKGSFVLTKDIRELLKNRYNYVLSPKGAGKSAVFKSLIEKYGISNKIIDLRKYHFIPINKAFDTTDDKYLDKEKFKSGLGHKIYTISWSLYIAIKLIEDILKNHSDKANFNTFQAEIIKYSNFKEKYELYNLLDYIEKFNIALKFTAGGIDYMIKPTFANKKQTKPLKLNEIFQLLNKFYEENNLIARVLIDRVDNFVEKEEFIIQKNYLQGLIYAIEEISHLPNIQPLLFLRTDLWYSHSIDFEYDKIRDRLIELKWTQAEILLFIVRRFLSIEQEHINKNQREFLRYCIERNYKRNGKENIVKRVINYFKQIRGKISRLDIEKTINYTISYQFLKLYFPNKISHLNKNNIEEVMDFDKWLFSHFSDGNNFVNPRTLLRFLNLLVKKQIDVSEEHNLFPNGMIEPKIEDDNLTYKLFRSEVIKHVYKDLQNEELRNIYKLLHSKISRDIFLRINQLSIKNSIVNFGDINLKAYNCEKDEFNRIISYLKHLGYLATIDLRTSEIKPIYRMELTLN